MQKLRYFSILLFAFCSSVQAQEFSFGIKAGLNRSSVIGDFREGFQGRISFHAGGFAEIPIKGKFSFHPELLYSSQGFTVDISKFNFENPGEPIFDSEDDTASTARNFLAIPLITRLNFTNSFSIEIGPQIGFLLSTVSKFDGEKNSFSGDFKFDIGPTFGLGYDIADKLKLQLRYFVGLSDFLRESRFEKSGIKDNQFDSVFQISAGYVIF